MQKSFFERHEGGRGEGSFNKIKEEEEEEDGSHTDVCIHVPTYCDKGKNGWIDVKKKPAKRETSSNKYYPFGQKDSGVYNR